MDVKELSLYKYKKLKDDLINMYTSVIKKMGQTLTRYRRTQAVTDWWIEIEVPAAEAAGNSQPLRLAKDLTWKPCKPRKEKRLKLADETEANGKEEFRIIPILYVKSPFPMHVFSQVKGFVRNKAKYRHVRMKKSRKL